MRKDLEHLTKEQREYLAEKIRKKISSGGYSIYADSEQCFNRIKSALEIKKNNPMNPNEIEVIDYEVVVPLKK
jgi:hypothetical protein